jgi:hypothetical protein
MSPRRFASGPAAAGLLLALALAGCRSSVLTTGQMRTQATRICSVATRQTNAIPTPTDPSGGEQFLNRGIAALDREVTRLGALRTTDAFGRAVDGSAGELAALRLALEDLRAGDDPVVTIKALAQQLAPLELRTDAAWAALGITACASR